MTTILLGRICRTCLQKSNVMHKLQEFIVDDLQIEEMLNKSVPNFDLEMDDIPLPVEICDNCLHKLRISYEFIQICLKSNKELRNILNQQEQEIENAIVAAQPQDVNILEETDILMDNFKKELQDDDSNSINCGKNALQRRLSPDYQLEAVKLEVEIQNENDKEYISSSDEYWPNDDKADSAE